MICLTQCRLSVLFLASMIAYATWTANYIVLDTGLIFFYLACIFFYLSLKACYGVHWKHLDGMSFLKTLDAPFI